MDWVSVDAKEAAASTDPMPADAVDVADPVVDAHQWLAAAGLEKHAQKIIAVSDAEAASDFGLLSEAQVSEVVASAGLKLVSAEKFRRAIMLLKGACDPSTAHATGGERAAQLGATLAAEEEAPRPVQESIAICIDRSGSMGSPFAEAVVNYVDKAVMERSRMEAVKAMFYGFRDRVEMLRETSGVVTELGLLQFDDRVETLLGLTTELDKFEAIIDDMKKRGTTAIYSAIIQGVRMLEPVFGGPSGATTDLRVLVLTDGQCNAGASPEAALEAVNAIGAIVDAIIVGDSPDHNLRKIVSASGGLCFQVKSLGEGFELLEGEGVASLRARRGDTEKPPFLQKAPIVDFKAIEEKSFTIAAPVARPAKPVHAVVDFGARGISAIDGGSGATRGSNACVKKVLAELRHVAASDTRVWLNDGRGVHLFPAEGDLTQWRALVEGPEGSPFEGGVFSLVVRIPECYPMRPPSIRFETPVYHCNVSESGTICLGLLQGDWSPTLSVPKAIEAVRYMLKDPDTDNALRQWIAELTMASKTSGGTDTRYVDEARRHTQKEAAKSVAEWRQEWAAPTAAGDSS